MDAGEEEAEEEEGEEEEGEEEEEEVEGEEEEEECEDAYGLDPPEKKTELGDAGADDEGGEDG